MTQHITPAELRARVATGVFADAPARTGQEEDTVSEPMAAGRELDALVAEKVMGLTVVAHDWPCGYDPECGYYEASMFAGFRDGDGSWYAERGPVHVRAGVDLWPPRPSFHEPDRLIAHVDPVPAYSTDIAAAWAVVEQVEDTGNGWVFSLAHRVIPDCWVARFTPLAVTGLVSEEADTVPLAICRAALAAVGAPS